VKRKDKAFIKWLTLGTLCLFLICLGLVVPAEAYYGGYYGGGYYGGGGYYPGSYGGCYGGGGYYGGGYGGGYYGGGAYSGMGYAGYAYPGAYSQGYPTYGPFGYSGIMTQQGFYNLMPGTIPPYSISGDWLKGNYMPYTPGFVQTLGGYTYPFSYSYGQNLNPANYLGMSILGSRSAIAGLGATPGWSGTLGGLYSMFGGFW